MKADMHLYVFYKKENNLSYIIYVYFWYIHTENTYIHL